MALESLINPKRAAGDYLEIFFVAIAYTAIAVFVAQQLFPAQVSLLAVSLLTMLFVPFFQKLFELDEEEEDKAARKQSTGNLFARHRATILTFTTFFLGVIVAVSALLVFFNVPFTLQFETLAGFSGAATNQGDFALYVANNTQVMFLIFALSVLFGAGAIFILAWNASVIGVFIGTFVQAKAAELGAVNAYVSGLPLGLATIALHGIPEIAAYFFAGLAGGILSVGILREKIASKEFRLIAIDALVFLAVAEFLIIAAAFIEAL